MGQTETKRVLMIAYHYPPEGGSSGVLRTLKFSKFLPESGWEPLILTFRENYYQSRDLALAQQIPSQVIVCRTRAIDTRRTLSIRGRYPRILATPDKFIGWLPFAVPAGLKLIRKYRIRTLFSTSPLASAHLVASVLKSLTHLPWVADFRDPWTEPETVSNLKSLWFRVDYALERSVLRKADRLVFTTSQARDYVLSHVPGQPTGKAVVIPNGYDEEDFRSLPDVQPDALPIQITHTGLVDESYRSPGGLLVALSRLLNNGEVSRGEVSVQFLGGGPYVESSNFRSLLESLRLSNVVRVLGRVGYPEALEVQQRSHILLLLQCGDDTRYSVPAKAFEYLRSGRPVLVVAPPSATSELFEKVGGGRVVHPLDEKRMETALREMLLAARAGNWKSNLNADALRSYLRRALTSRLAQALQF